MVYNAMDSSEKEACRAKNRANMKRKYLVKQTEKHIKKLKTSSEDVILNRCMLKFQSRVKEGSSLCMFCL